MATPETTPDDARDIPGRLLKGVAVLGGLVLFGIMCLVSYAVFARYVLNQPILGGNEIVQIGMALVVMMAMPFTTLKNGHIRVDVLDPYLGATGRFLSDIMVRVVSCYVLYLLVDKTWDKALDAHEYGDVTNMVEIPVWIAYGAITIGMVLVIVVLLGQLVLQLKRGIARHE